MSIKHPSVLNEIIMEFLPGFYRTISPVVNNSNYQDKNLHENQIKVIAALEFEGKPLSPGTISTIINIQKGSLTRILRTLLTIGFISKKADQKDERKYSISLTASGKEFFKDHLKHCNKTLDKLFENMTAVDKAKVAEGFSVLNNYLSDKGFNNERS